MLTPRTISAKFAPSYISTGDLPGAVFVQPLVDEAYAQFKSDRDENAQVFPPPRVRSELVGVCIASARREVCGAGETDFMSVSKPLVSALVSKLIGAGATGDRLGANAAGFPSSLSMPSRACSQSRTHTRHGCRQRPAEKDVRLWGRRKNGSKG